MAQIADWLARLGLSKYAEAFAAHEVDFETLRHLSEADLKELGLPLGPRRKVLAALAEEEAQAKKGSLTESRREAERRQLTIFVVGLRNVLLVFDRLYSRSASLDLLGGLDSGVLGRDQFGRPEATVIDAV